MDALINLAGPEDRAAVPDLSALLRHADPDVARGAALALGNIGGRDAAAAVPVLRQALQDEDPAVRSLAAAALANIGPNAAAAVPDLTAALTDESQPVRRNAALALGRIGPAARSAIPDLARALRPEEPSAAVRQFAAEAIAHIGQEATDERQFREIERLVIDQALPALLRALQHDTGPGVRHRAVWALFLVQDPEKAGLVGPLTAVLHERDPEIQVVRYDAARCLALRLGPRTPDKAIDVLLEMLNDDRLRIYNRTDAQVSGGGEGQTGDSRVAANLGGDARFLAAQALARIGPKANRPAIIAALKDAQQSPDKRCRDEAAKALAIIQGR